MSLRAQAVLTTGRRDQAAEALIEVLVAVLILSIGFLGIAALQMRSLSMNNSAMARSVAAMESYSILDAMRADRANAQDGSYNGTVYGNNCPTAAGSLATTQLAQWCHQLAAGLGASASAVGSIRCHGTQGFCTVTVTYDDSKSRSSAEDGMTMQTVTTQAML